MESEHLRAGVPEELRNDESEERRFSRSRRTHHESVPNISAVQIEAKRSRTRRRRVQQRRAFRRIERARIFFISGPHRAYRKKVREVERVENNAPHIAITISRKATSPGLDAVYVFDPCREAQDLYRLRDQRAGFFVACLILIAA